MSDVPGGDGWWMASDGKWYAPELHPDHQVPPTPPVPSTTIDAPPASGWWKASDGEWYPPERHPNYVAPRVAPATDTNRAVTVTHDGDDLLPSTTEADATSSPPEPEPASASSAAVSDPDDGAEDPGTAFTIDVDFSPKVFYALAHSRIPFVRRISIRNDGGGVSGNLRVEISSRWSRSTNGPVKTRSESVACPELGDTVELAGVDLRLDDGELAVLEEACPATLVIRLIPESGPAQEEECDIEVLARNEWAYVDAFPSAIAAFVQPNHPAVNRVLDRASAILKQETGSGALEGYQSGPERAATIAQSIFMALQEFIDNYINPPASFQRTGQQVRTIDRVLEERQGTCIDLACAYASALEQAGLHPLIWLLDGHAFAGFLADQRHLPDPATSEVNTILQYVEADLAISVETVCIPGNIPFGQALVSTASYLNEQKIESMIDVKLAHRSGVRPIPARVVEGDVITVVIDPGPGAAPIVEKRDARTNVVLPESSPARIETWKSSLLDLSMRNALLNFKPSKSGAQLLPAAGRLADIEDTLHNGQPIVLLANDEVGDLQRAAGIRAATAEANDLLDDVWTRFHAVFSTSESASFMTKIRGIRSRANQLEQETGANNLYLTLGSIHWEDTKSSVGLVESPIFLVPIRISAKRGSETPVVELDPRGMSTPNYCLLEALKVRHNLDVPFFSEDMADDAGLDIARGLQAVRTALIDRGLAFRVDDSAAIALLQFGKFRLWKDLTDHWQQFMNSPVVKHFVDSPKTPFRDPANPERLPMTTIDETAIYTPVPADGAQLAAVSRAVGGESFVLEGPPGTGKSQTITNLLGNALASGRTVLFVAEKQAALSVVKERLADVGLDPYCLDLHDKGSNPSDVRKQLLEALDHAPSFDERAWEEASRDVGAATDILTAYRDRLHLGGESGTSYWEANLRLLELGPGAAASVPRVWVESIEPPTGTVRDLLSRLSEVATPASPRPGHPWRLAGSVEFGLLDRPALATTVIALNDVLSALPDGVIPMLDAAGSADEAAAVATVLTLAGRSALPPVDAWSRIADPVWAQRANEQLAHAQAVWLTHAAFVATCPAQVLFTDHTSTLAALAAAEQAFAIGRKGKIRKALGELAGSPPFLGLEPTAAAELVRQVATARADLVAAADGIRGIEGIQLPSDWRIDDRSRIDDVAAQLQIVAEAARLVTASTPAGDAARQFVTTPGIIAAGAADSARTLATQIRALTALLASTDESVASWVGGTTLLSALRRSVGEWAADAGDSRFRALQLWTAFATALQPLRELGLAAFAEELASGAIPATDAGPAFERGLMQTALTVRGENTNMDVFNRHVHTTEVDRLRTASERRSELARSVLPTLLSARRQFNPAAGVGEVANLRNELKPRRRGARSIRQLLSTYPSLIQQLSPCFLMSPDSVAKFLEPGKITFDVVVFDEASQIRVADAVGALGRARSAVIVGDSRQMPPTKVAQAGTSAEDPFADVDDDPLVAEDADSILEEAIESGLDQQWLSWHYRSADESLIRFSNDRYYDSGLATFPIPAPNTAGLGIEYHRIEGQFDHGGTRRNPAEARFIAAEIQRRVAAAGSHPPSIGVVTFNKEQAAEVADQLTALNDLAVSALLDDSMDDAILIRNLEEVQGQERDVVFISTAFSRPVGGGKMPLNFGPLNNQGGERRLNVAVTRARRQVVVVSSFDPEEIEESRTKSLGMIHLREYLMQARTISQAHEEGLAEPSQADLYSEEVATALRARGVVVTPQFGLSRFRVDLALTLPETSDRQLVAVLFDSDVWAERPTAIDRDVLPPNVLDRTWPRVVRLWLPSWRNERDEIIDELVHVVHTAASEPEPTVQPPGPPVRPVMPEQDQESDPAVEEAEGDPSPEASDAPPDQRSDREIRYPGATLFTPWPETPLLGSTDQLDQLDVHRAAVQAAILDALATEGPIAADRLAKKVGRRFGLGRVQGGRVASILSVVPDELISSSEFGDFVWPAGLDPATWTSFRTEGNDRAITEIAPEEIVNAMVAITKSGGSVEREELERETALVFGIRRFTTGIAEHLDRVVDAAVSADWLNEDDGRLTAP
jgi:hypothetical protein